MVFDANIWFNIFKYLEYHQVLQFFLVSKKLTRIVQMYFDTEVRKYNSIDLLMNKFYCSLHTEHKLDKCWDCPITSCSKCNDGMNYCSSCYRKFCDICDHYFLGVWKYEDSDYCSKHLSDKKSNRICRDCYNDSGETGCCVKCNHINYLNKNNSG